MSRQRAERLVQLCGVVSALWILLAFLVAILDPKTTWFWPIAGVAFVTMVVGIFINIRYNVEEDES